MTQAAGAAPEDEPIVERRDREVVEREPHAMEIEVRVVEQQHIEELALGGCARGPRPVPGRQRADEQRHRREQSQVDGAQSVVRARSVGCCSVGHSTIDRAKADLDDVRGGREYHGGGPGAPASVSHFE
ncbi:MAG: hypothetical protein U1E76_03855 [Planctomycetota bacterium]